MYTDFYTDIYKNLHSLQRTYHAASVLVIKIYSPRIRLVFAPPKAKLFDITVEIF